MREGVAPNTFAQDSMTTLRTDPERRLQELLETAARADVSEDDIKRRVANLIEVLAEGQTARQEVQTATGIIDILVGNVIIEAKTDANRLVTAPSWAMGDINLRRQYAASQLQDYVNERYRGIKSESSVFDGYTTNGSKWHRWAVTVGGDAPELVWSKDLTQPALDAAAQSGIDRASIIDDLFNDITSTLASRPPPPDDLQQLLSDLPDAAYEIAKTLAANTDFQIKRSVWSDLMRGAFVLTDGDDERNLKLFATHSVLVDMARKVAANVVIESQASNDRDDSAFYSWLYADAAARGLTERISREVNRYNWSIARVDILKGIYHEFIPRDIRHDFGEYYTPDWLAEAVCEYVLDDAWCRDAVRKAADPEIELNGIGVLEPSCGSGTFLRAAALRLLPFAREKTDDKVEQANIICSLIHGLDIHPVAVELARATMLAALPATPTHGHEAVNVHISDSLRWMQDTEMRLLGDGILINVPKVGALDQVDVLIPSSVVLHPDFNRIIDEMITLGNNTPVLRQRFNQLGFNLEDTDVGATAAETLFRLRREDRNHVWSWYIKNVAEAHRLHQRKFNRIVGNPPWITRKDITRGDRQRADRHRSESIKMNVWAGGITHATQNNLAALFAAAVTRDYTDPTTEWRVGFVLPWSALRTETWSNFRKGRWNRDNAGAHDEWAIDLSETPWDLRGVDRRPFPQSDSCVIFGRNAHDRTASIPLSSEHQLWELSGANQDSMWSDVAQRINRRLVSTATHAPSQYLDRCENGATLFPAALIRIDTSTIESGGIGFKRFKLSRSRHGEWASVDLGTLTIEDDCVRQATYADDLAPFRLLRQSMACLPPNDAFTGPDSDAAIARYERFNMHWSNANELVLKHHGDTHPSNLMDRVNYREKASEQLMSTKQIRVAYPGSGRWFFGVALPTDIIVNHGCYYIDVDCQDEAHYLCALFASDALQNAYRNAQVTDRHYDKHPLRAVPIPAYNPSDDIHAQLALLGNRAQTVAAQVNLSGGTNSMRNDIRAALRDDGVMQDIDRCAKELLPDYADATT